MKKTGKTLVKCDFCGTDLLVFPCLMKRNKKHFCNPECRDNWHRKNAIGEKAPRWKGGRIETKCSQCKKVITRKRAEMMEHEHHFCSKECDGKWRSEHRCGPVVYNWQDRIKIPCDQCGKGLLRLKSRAEAYDHNFCDRSCMAKWRSENICQERAYQWKGGVIAAQKRFRSNPKARVNARMASAMGASLKGNKRGRSWEKLAGYTCDQLIKHLKGTMPEGYSWSDFMGGDLEIDHVIPQAVFNFSSPSHIDFKRCWDIKNLQLLPARKNRQKGARIDAPFQPSLALQVPI